MVNDRQCQALLAFDAETYRANMAGRTDLREHTVDWVTMSMLVREGLAARDRITDHTPHRLTRAGVLARRAAEQQASLDDLEQLS